jgi:hypothetical protein
MVRRHSHLFITVDNKLLSQTKRVNPEIIAPKAAFDYYFPDACSTEKKHIRCVKQKRAGLIGKFIRLAGRPEQDMGVQQ